MTNPIISQSLKQQLQIIRNYPFAASIIFTICLLTPLFSHTGHEIVHGLVYLFVVWLGAFVTDVVVNMWPKPAVGYPVKEPVKKEALTILICTLLGITGLSIRFFCDWQHLNHGTRLAVLPLFLFVFPVVLAIIYLFVYKYKPKELGINFRYWYLPLIIHVIVGAASLLVVPERSHWKDALQQMGLTSLLFTGIVTAALPEEFLRMLLQTRLGLLFRNAGTGFIAATMLWAFMHVPILGQHYKTEGPWPAFSGAITIMPAGFLWGYITHRTKSVIPAVLIHGLNLWGLQNF